MQEELEYCVNTEGGSKTGSVFASKAMTVYDTKARCDASIRTYNQVQWSWFSREKTEWSRHPASLLISRPNMN